MPAITARWAIRCLFAIGAISMGLWAVRIAGFKEAANLSHQALALFLLLAPITLQIVMFFIPRITRLLGVRAMNLWGLAAINLAVLGLSFIPPKFAIALCFVMLGAGAALLEIGLNAVAQKLDREGKPIMLSAHGFWSVGFALGMFFGGWFADLGLAFWLQEIIFAPLLLAMAWPLNALLPQPRPSSVEQNNVLPTWSILPYCFIPVAALFTEGSIADWGAVFLSEEHAIRPLGIGIITGLFMGGMAATRLTGDWLRKFFSNINLLIASNLALMIGLALFALSASPFAIGFGALTAGLGAGMVYPIVLVIANSGRDEEEAAGIIAAIASVSFVSFLIAPPFMGFIAEHASLSLAFALLIPLSALGFLWIWLIRRA